MEKQNNKGTLDDEDDNLNEKRQNKNSALKKEYIIIFICLVIKIILRDINSRRENHK